jgi:hypothetical protein
MPADRGTTVLVAARSRAGAVLVPLLPSVGSIVCSAREQGGAFSPVEPTVSVANRRICQFAPLAGTTQPTVARRPLSARHPDPAPLSEEPPDQGRRSVQGQHPYGAAHDDYGER